MGWQDFYTTAGNDFGILPNSKFYGPQGHRGKDFKHGTGAAIPVYAKGTVALIDSSPALGSCVVVELEASGLFAGWAHTKDIAVGVGDPVKPGDTIAHVAGADDQPGTSWAGSHAHTTLGSTKKSIFFGDVENPMRLIRPAIITANLMEDDMFESKDRNRLNNVWAGLYKGASVQIGSSIKKFNYGILPIVVHNQELIAQQSGRISALEEAVAQLAAGTNVVLDDIRIGEMRDRGIHESTNQGDLPIIEELDNIDGVDVIRVPDDDEPEQ